MCTYVGIVSSSCQVPTMKLMGWEPAFLNTIVNAKSWLFNANQINGSWLSFLLITKLKFNRRLIILLNTCRFLFSIFLSKINMILILPIFHPPYRISFFIFFFSHVFCFLNLRKCFPWWVHKFPTSYLIGNPSNLRWSSIRTRTQNHSCWP